MYINKIVISLPLTRENAFTKEWVPAYGYPFQIKNVRFDDGVDKITTDVVKSIGGSNYVKYLFESRYPSISQKHKFFLISPSQNLNLKCVMKLTASKSTTASEEVTPSAILSGTLTEESQKNPNKFMYTTINEPSSTYYGIPKCEFIFSEPIDLKGIYLNLGPKFDNDESYTDRDYIYRIESFINNVRRSCNDLTSVKTDLNIDNSFYVPFKDTYSIVKRDNKIYYLKPKENEDGDDNITLLKDWNIQRVGPYDLNGITYGNKEFITVGLNGSMYASKDGINWTPRNTEFTDKVSSISDIAAYSNSLLYMTTLTGSSITALGYISKDGGYNWTIGPDSKRTYKNGSSTSKFSMFQTKIKYLPMEGYVFIGSVPYNGGFGTYLTQPELVKMNFTDSILLGSTAAASLSSTFFDCVDHGGGSGYTYIMVRDFNNTGKPNALQAFSRAYSATTYSAGTLHNIKTLNGGRDDVIDSIACYRYSSTVPIIALSYYYPSSKEAALPYPSNLNLKAFSYMSTDDGKTWTCKLTNIPGRIFDLKYFDNIGAGLNGFWGVGENGLVVNTTDNGETWKVMKLPTTDTLKRIVYESNIHTWVIIGDNGFVATYEGTNPLPKPAPEPEESPEETGDQ